MRRAYKQLLAKNLVVNLRSGKAFSGALWSDTRDLLVLRNAVLHEAGQTTDVDGEVVIERSNIDFIQVLPTKTRTG